MTATVSPGLAPNAPAGASMSFSGRGREFLTPAAAASFSGFS